MNEGIQNAWSRIESWLKAQAPSVLVTLRVPASDHDVLSTERILGVTLPDDVRMSFMIHNGQSIDEYGGTLGLIDAQELLSLDRLIDVWEMWKESYDKGRYNSVSVDAENGIRPLFWIPLWIPLTYGVHGSYCLDLSPGPNGHVGQIITVWRDDQYRRLVAPSLVDWLEVFVNELESGEYVLSEDIGGLVRLDDA